MTISATGAVRSFAEEMAKGTHDFVNDTFKCALYEADASLTYATTHYGTDGEVSGANYTAGGEEVSVITGAPVAAGNVTVISFNDVTFSNLTLSPGAGGALIYNSSKSNKAVCILKFNQVYAPSAEDLTINMPGLNQDDALIRILSRES